MIILFSDIRFRLLAIFLLFYSPVASAHFNLNLNVRVIHVEHTSAGLNIYMRLPMPYLVAHLLGEAEGDELPAPAPYTSNQMEDDQLMHYVDSTQLRADPAGFRQLAHDSIDLTIDGKPAAAEITKLRIHRNGRQPDFATLEDAKQVFDQSQSFEDFGEGVYVGDTTVDVYLKHASNNTIDSYGISSSLDPGLQDQEKTANLVLDHRPGDTQVFRSRGLMHEPIIVTHSALDAMKTFIGEGIKHILEGIDHVLFVVCLVLGAMRIKPLLWRVTGFTIGHSITLSLGFFGFVPSAAWFVPAVETGIALSIIYVAVIAVLPDIKPTTAPTDQNEWKVSGITTLIGLLHGLGFSFVLHNILQVTSPNIWQSLLAFNIGVEVGQLMIVIATLVFIQLIGRYSEKAKITSRLLIAGLCILVSVYWVYDRSINLVASL